MNAIWLLCGVLLALWTPDALQAPLTWAAAGGACVLLFSPWRSCALIVLAGILHSQTEAGLVLGASYDCNERRLVVARIESIPAATDGGWQFDARVWMGREAQPVGRQSQPDGLRVRLSYPAAVAPHAGEKWQFLVQFAAPADGVEGRNLLRDRISARARVRDSPLNRRLAAASWSIDVPRERVSQQIARRVADPAAAGLLSALAVGVTGDVSTAQWRVFNATGITHLVAISGMHVTFFAMLCMSLARLVWRRWPGRALPWRRESFAAAVGVTLAFAYALLSGFSVPAQRTAVMLAAFLIARCCGRATSPSWSVGVSLAAVLLFDPLAALSAGFWLSFCAVAAIVLFAGGQLLAAAPLRAGAHVQWVVTVALLPLTMLLFGSFSLIGPLVNAVAIPVFTFALVPPLLVATALHLLPFAVAQAPADLLIEVTGWVAGMGWPALARSADWPIALLAADPGFWWFCLGAPAALVLLLPLPAGMRAATAALICSAFMVRAARPAAGELEIRMLDVGASRAVLLRTSGHQLLLGAGESFGGDGRRFEARVLPELSRGGYRVLDLLVLDRTDRDNLRAVLRADARLHLRQVVAADVRRTSPELMPCAARTWRWDGVEFTMHGASGGCWVSARAGMNTFLAAPERRPGALLYGPAQVLLLPRAARDAAAVLRQSAAADAILLASVSGRDWESEAWRHLRGQADARRLMATAAEGSLLVTLRPQATPKLRQLPRGRPGIWSRPPAARCRSPEARGGQASLSPRSDGWAMMRAHVGNRARGRPVHVADHPVLHHLGSDRAGAAVDSAAAPRGSAGPDAQDLGAG